MFDLNGLIVDACKKYGMPQEDTGYWLYAVNLRPKLPYSRFDLGSNREDFVLPVPMPVDPARVQDVMIYARGQLSSIKWNADDILFVVVDERWGGVYMTRTHCIDLNCKDWEWVECGCDVLDQKTIENDRLTGKEVSHIYLPMNAYFELLSEVSQYTRMVNEVDAINVTFSEYKKLCLLVNFIIRHAKLVYGAKWKDKE